MSNTEEALRIAAGRSEPQAENGVYYNRMYRFAPKDDMTAKELALIMQQFPGSGLPTYEFDGGFLMDVDESLLRHFEQVL